MKKVEQLSKRQRALTPLPLCKMLVERVLAAHPAERVAVLWVCDRTNYGSLWPATDCWNRARDSRTYSGPYPVICHPPCGPWGNYKAVALESREHGIMAMEFVHKWCGVVEQPVGSELFRLHGKGGRVEEIRLCDYGFPAVKRTLLYWV